MSCENNTILKENLANNITAEKLNYYFEMGLLTKDEARRLANDSFDNLNSQLNAIQDMLRQLENKTGVVRGKLKTEGIVDCPVHPTKNGDYFPTVNCPDCRFK